MNTSQDARAITVRVAVTLALVVPLLVHLQSQGGVVSVANEPTTWTAADDHRHMMTQLGIRRLRPGPSGNESAPNQANYDEATANPFPDLPDVLTRKNGKKVTTARDWWNERRPEIVEDFAREVLGRVPRNVPRVTWTVARTAEWIVGSHPVIGKQRVGHVDNAAYPAISIDLQMTLVTPAKRSAHRDRGVFFFERFSAIPADSALTVRFFRRLPRRSSDKLLTAVDVSFGTIPRHPSEE